MFIAKFDFTKFTKEKWQKIISKIEGDYNEVTGVKVDCDLINGELIPFVEVDYDYETEVDGVQYCTLTFNAFEIKECPQGRATKVWRKIMLKEFGDVYYNSLINHLTAIKEQKIQQADEEYENQIRDLNRNLYI